LHAAFATAGAFHVGWKVAVLAGAHVVVTSCAASPPESVWKMAASSSGGGPPPSDPSWNVLVPPELEHAAATALSGARARRAIRRRRIPMTLCTKRATGASEGSPTI
jgi:hypothetical protein